MPSGDQGVQHRRYALIPRTLIFLTRGGRVLLIKGAAHKRLWANQYNGLGGHVERGEDVLSAARRELAEETGLLVQDLWHCGVITVDPGGEVGVVIFVLRGECSVGEPVPSPEGSLEWVSFADIDRLPLVEDLYALLPRALAAKRGEPPVFGHYWYDAGDRLVIRFVE